MLDLNDLVQRPPTCASIHTATAVSRTGHIVGWCVTPAQQAEAVLLSPRQPPPPVVTIRVTPETLWPANGRLVPVTVTGTITDAGGGLDTRSAAYAVTDEYRQVQPQGSVALRADGSYAFSILLQASRKGTDKDGRQYIITVSAHNTAGTKGSAATGVRVPHDQGQVAATR